MEFEQNSQNNVKSNKNWALFVNLHKARAKLAK